ncbi:MAG TPA: outer membrane protein transport protein [Myxococcaceae bacterium]|nr:outer membrane protein transport protein [Myxococcaceae bacterium]
MSRRRWRSPGVVTLACMGVWLVPTAAHAGGLFLYEVGTSDIGFASAGYAARANAPVTLLTNPAGMTRLDGIQVQVGTELLYANLSFAPDLATSPFLGTNNGGNAIGGLPNGAVFATFAPWKDFRFGLGIFSNFGAPEKWDTGWVGRYYTTKTTLLGLSIMPGVAWNIIGGLSVGITFNMMYGHLSQSVAVQNLEPLAPDGSLSVTSNAWGFGGNVGLLYEFSPATRLGVTYTSPVKLSFAAVPTFSGVGARLSTLLKASGLDTASIDLGMTVPQTVMISFFQAVGSKFALMADVGWQNWASFGTVQLGITSTPPVSLTTNIGYVNTWHGAIGAQVQLSEPWQLNLGMAYDSSMTNAQDRVLMMAIADQWRLGAGAQVAVDEHWNLGFCSELLWGGSPSVVQDRGPLAGHVSGAYDNFYILFFSFNFTWKS